MTNTNIYALSVEDNDETRELIEGLKSFGQGGEYADPTTDTGFKHLLSPSIEGNKEIIKSFLNTFVPDFAHDPVKDVEEASVFIPVLPKEKMQKEKTKQKFMDVHVVSQSRHHYVIEMQASRHINFDERVLYYTAATFVQQLSEKELEEPIWYKNLKPIIAIQVLGYDTNRVLGIKDNIPDDLLERAKSNPLPKGQFIKHYMLTDEHSGQKIKHLQMIQIELPRARESLFPPQQDFTLIDWWLSILKFAPRYTNDFISDLEKKGIVMPTVIAQALDRLSFSKWNPQEIHEYKSDTIEREKYAIEFASERAEGEQAGIDKKAREVAKELIVEGMTVEKVRKVTKLSLEVVEELEAEVARDS